MQAVQLRAVLALSFKGEPQVTSIVLQWGVKGRLLRNKPPVPRGCWMTQPMWARPAPPPLGMPPPAHQQEVCPCRSGKKPGRQRASLWAPGLSDSEELRMAWQCWKQVPLILQGWSESSKIVNSTRRSLKKGGCQGNHLKACFNIFATYSKAAIISCCQITTALQRSLRIFFNDQGKNSYLLSRQMTEFWSGILSL